MVVRHVHAGTNVNEMHKLAKKIIEKRISKIIEEYDYEKRKKKNPEECICYNQNKKCHDVENLNCLFCFCPNYNLGVREGGCKINSPSGKYIETSNGKIWDCSDCDWPHKKDNAEKVLMKLYNFEQ